MVHSDIDEALQNVRELKIRILDSQLFRGYSGTARILSGVAALVTAIGMSLSLYPKGGIAMLGGWAGLYLIALFLNLGALFGRFLGTSRGLSDWPQLRPVLYVIPPFLLASVLSLHFVLRGIPSSLYGMWMGMYGLMHLSSPHVLPKANMYVGWFYVLCGAYFLWQTPDFFNPWPMGIVFFLGEVVGGLIFLRSTSEARPHA